MRDAWSNDPDRTTRREGMGPRVPLIVGNDVMTWADGFGLWHALVNTSDPSVAENLGRDAIVHELIVRGEDESYVPTVVLTPAVQDGRSVFVVSEV